MKTTDNTILITGGGTGIGRGLAEAFHALGNQVIISGRTAKSLEETIAANPGMKALTLDIDSPASIAEFGTRIAAEFPQLNVVLHNAGIMRSEALIENTDTSEAEAMVTTNLLGPIRLNSVLLPGLMKQPSATILTVSSGLAFLPLALTPPIARPRRRSIPTASRCGINSAKPPSRCSNSSRPTSAPR